MTKQDYLNQIGVKKELQKKIKNDPYRLGFHLMGPSGWVNDPNGLCQFKGTHHIYFQYTPFSPLWGMKCWGHYSTKDYLHFKEEEPFLYPDCSYDRDGVYSGSAFVEENQIHYFYTGNVKLLDKEYDYILEGREQNTLHITSNDGYTYDQKSLVLDHDDYPSDMSKHVRDPKVFKEGDDYYMVLGARDVNDCGLVLLYHSKDLEKWTFHMRIQTKNKFGYMWECPDLIELDGQKFLIICPQGVQQEKYQYQNVYQLGYFPIDLDLHNKSYHLKDFVEFDGGFDIYASQTYVDDLNRRILIAWMGIPDASYHNQQTIDCGWQHALTMPRELTQHKGKIFQKPIDELKNLRKSEYKELIVKQKEFVAEHDLIELILANINNDCFSCIVKEDIKINYEQGVLSFNIEPIGNGRTLREMKIASLDKLHIFIDHSCIEIFVNDGEKTITSRFYSLKPNKIEIQGECDLELYQLDSMIIDYLSVE